MIAINLAIHYLFCYTINSIMIFQKKFIFLFGFISLLFLFFFKPNISFAQTATPTVSITTPTLSSSSSAATMGVATFVQVKDVNLKDGTVISSADNGAIATDVSYDSQVLGVIAKDAAILLNSGGSANSLPVISVGNVYVLVSTKDGVIKKGDLLTSSTIPGVAVKAVRSGYVLGTALEGYDNPDPKKIDTIVADLNLHYFNSKPTFPGTLSDLFKFIVLSTKEDPTPIFKDIVAALVVLGSFVLAFLTFGRAAAKGVEALGRNPAASRIIHLGIIFNVTIVGLIIIAGMTVAFLILRL